MCTKIDCENVIVSYFGHTEQKELTFRDLNIIRREIEKKESSVFVDVSFASIRKTAVKFQDSIEIENNTIHLVGNKPSLQTTGLDHSFLEIIKDRIKANSHQ